MKKFLTALKIIWNVITNLKFFYRITRDIIRSERKRWKEEDELRDKGKEKPDAAVSELTEPNHCKELILNNRLKHIYQAEENGKLIVDKGIVECEVRLDFIEERKRSDDFDPFILELQVPDMVGTIWSQRSYILPDLLTYFFLNVESKNHFKLKNWEDSSDTFKENFNENIVISGIRILLDNDSFYEISIDKLSYGIRCKNQQPEVTMAINSDGIVFIKVKQLFFWEYDEYGELLDVNEVPEFYFSVELFRFLPDQHMIHHSADVDDMNDIDDPKNKKPIIFKNTNKIGKAQKAVQYHLDALNP